MTLKEIEEKVIKQNESNFFTEKQEDIDKSTIELLVYYIKNHVDVVLTEEDIFRISNMYYGVFHQYNLKFLNQIIKLSHNEIDMYKVLSKLELL